MSASRRYRRLLRLYPSRWRERYGEELEALIADSGGGARISWRVRLDIVRAAARERLRAAGLSGKALPSEQVRGGTSLVLCAWALYVIGGAGVQKLSEHWQDVTPAADRAFASGAFAGLVAAAVAACVLVIVGVGCAVPSVVRLVRGGGWAVIRRWMVTAAASGVVTAAATVALVIWAATLTPPQRDGHDAAYAAAFVGWALLVAASLGVATAAAVATARRLALPARTLRVQAWLAGAVTVAMTATTAATATWWVAMAHAAPWFLAGRAPGQGGSPVAAQLVLSTALMTLASALAWAGAGRAIRARPALPDE